MLILPLQKLWQKLVLIGLRVDLEHSVITTREAEEIIRIIELSGVTPLVRLTSNNPHQIKRMMDAGAHGIIIPMINSREEAQSAVDSVYYPTRGKRGVGLARAQGYGARFQEYRHWLEEQAIIIVQIEHIQAVKNINEILSVPHVDGYIIGPYDLSASLGHPGEFTHPEVVEAIEQIKSAAKHLGKPGGIHLIEPDPQALHQHIQHGSKFIAYSLDIRMLDAQCRLGVRSINQEL